MEKRKYGHKRKKNRKFLGSIVCAIKARLWLLTMTSLITATMSGCGDEASKAPDIEIVAENTEEPLLTESDLNESDLTKSDWGNEDSIGMIYGDIYKEIAEENAPDSLKTMRHIISRLGEKGYAAVDSENQIDMAEAEKALEFCEAVDEKKSAELTMIVIENQGFQKFDFKTEKGNVYVIKEYYRYDNKGYFQKVSTVSYPADLWQYTEEGYLIFEGSYDSEEDFVLTLSDVTEHAALRILPLDETCRELNRKYILPVGYGRNNLFLTDWGEEDFGDLDFYDVFDCFYPILYQQLVPYAYNENLEIGAVYQIPEDIFENVITTHFNIDTEKLRLKTAYLSKESAYEYRPRGFYEVEYPEIPYPEVVDYTENPDGTITLTINAVYPEENTSKAYSHKTVIRPLSEEDFQYVSNEMIPCENNFDIWWHSDRLTEEEWQETYGENVDADKTENGYNLPISDKEKKRKPIVKKCWGLYGNCTWIRTKAMLPTLEYLYVMKYQERFPFEAYPEGIPKEEFEHLIMEYLPITAEELRNYAVFDVENQTYEWAELSCINYAPAYFGTSVPEITHIKKNREGALTLTVDAVCDMILCDDAVITHELTVRFTEDGGFQYLGNKILDDGIKYIPDYQYRVYAEQHKT